MVRCPRVACPHIVSRAVSARRRRRDPALLSGHRPERESRSTLAHPPRLSRLDLWLWLAGRPNKDVAFEPRLVRSDSCALLKVSSYRVVQRQNNIR